MLKERRKKEKQREKYVLAVWGKEGWGRGRRNMQRGEEQSWRGINEGKKGLKEGEKEGMRVIEGRKRRESNRRREIG